MCKLHQTRCGKGIKTTAANSPPVTAKLTNIRRCFTFSILPGIWKNFANCHSGNTTSASNGAAYLTYLIWFLVSIRCPFCPGRALSAATVATIGGAGQSPCQSPAGGPRPGAQHVG